MSLGAAACDDDGIAAEPSAPPATSPTANGGSTSAAPTSPSSGTPSPSASPSSKPTSDPKVSGSQVIMIDPDGKKYTRTEMIQLAVGMAAVYGEKGLPANFCSISYKEGVDGGGKFPAGRAAFIEACQLGVKLAS
ncbi:hypothetical protein [Actinomadura alba]|uniref:Lipoprotein n=1 Tax=Actinomadura alba TaxID=406431 RepID=A0ABR7LRM8_9ACTN|nr:hypothetical protein [Actinomadura alba]MBC6467492.1 hypothetical protein [Actinomadura alba]